MSSFAPCFNNNTSSDLISQGSGVLQEMYPAWKTSIQARYNFFTNHNLYYATLTAEWGPLLSSQEDFDECRLYYGEFGEAPFLVHVDKVSIPRIDRKSIDDDFNEDNPSPFITTSSNDQNPDDNADVTSWKHPTSSPTAIKASPHDTRFIATHCSTPHVYVWNVQTRVNKKVTHKHNELPDFELTGHLKEATALVWGKKDMQVISGGEDHLVVLWNARDEDKKGNLLPHRMHFLGHKGTVTDVTFLDETGNCFASVGNDKRLLLWDQRAGKNATLSLMAHQEPIKSVGVNPFKSNLLMTASDDKTIQLWDLSYLPNNGTQGRVTPLEVIHTWDAVMKAQWSPHSSDKLAFSIANQVVIYDVKLRIKAFTHYGHRYEVDGFAWNPHVGDGLMCSYSSDAVEGGSTMQIWKPLWAPLGTAEEEKELNKQQQFIANWSQAKNTDQPGKSFAIKTTTSANKQKTK